MILFNPWLFPYVGNELPLPVNPPAHVAHRSLQSISWLSVKCSVSGEAMGRHVGKVSKLRHPNQDFPHSPFERFADLRARKPAWVFSARWSKTWGMAFCARGQQEGLYLPPRHWRAAGKRKKLPFFPVSQQTELHCKQHSSHREFHLELGEH